VATGLPCPVVAGPVPAPLLGLWYLQVKALSVEGRGGRYQPGALATGPDPAQSLGRTTCRRKKPFLCPGYLSKCLSVIVSRFKAFP
jgi:hypothetical protein